jgi:hypothetical protein
MDSTADCILSPAQKSQLHCELVEGENVLWVGRPSVSRALLTGDALVPLVMGLIWTPMIAPPAIMMTVHFVSGGVEPGQGWVVWPIALAVHFVLWVFAFVGLWMLSIPLWTWHKTRHTFYAVTDRRAIICEPLCFRGVQIRSYFSEDLRGVLARNERSDRSGDLILEEYLARGAKGGSVIKERGFMGIPHVREVEQIVRGTLLGRMV